ncbi:MFS transporter [Undibacterium sp.]|uniref:MFS transporter n=1 Tax=Undibacterium sp. TaxID=1914977 RepID=UPI0025E35BC3|nr:MFS transporter [Undibacterium sp.]
MLAALKQLPRTVWLIGLISLVNDSASEMVYPLIPLYLSSVLMAGPRALGIIEGIAEATASLLKLFSGIVVDQTRRAKPWILFGYSLAAFARPMMVLVTSWHGLLLIRFADRVGKGLRSSPRDALLANSVTAERRGLAFGVHRAMDNAGAVIGPLLAALLLGAGMAIKDIFLWTLIPALLCVAFALLIDEPGEKKTIAVKKFDSRLKNMSPVFKRYLIVVALFTLGNSSNMFLLLRARELGVAQAQVPLLWAAVSLVAMLFSAPLSALSDRYGRLRLLLAGYLAYALFYFAMGSLSTHGIMLYALFGFYGLFLAATEGVEKALVADLAPEGLQGAAFGWFNMTTGIMLLPASILFGHLYQTVSPFAAFTFSACCAALAALLMWRWVDLAQT